MNLTGDNCPVCHAKFGSQYNSEQTNIYCKENDHTYLEDLIGILCFFDDIVISYRNKTNITKVKTNLGDIFLFSLIGPPDLSDGALIKLLDKARKLVVFS